MLIGAPVGFFSSSTTTFYGADFSSSSSIYRSASPSLIGLADSKKGLISFWFRLDTNNGTLKYIHGNFDGNTGSKRFNVSRNTSNYFQIVGKNSSDTTILDIRTSDTFTTSSTWHHLMASWDMSTTGARHIYVDDSTNLIQTTFTNDTIAYATTGASPSWNVANDGDNTGSFRNCLAEVYFTTEYLDLSSSTNRSKFISGGRPVDLGTDGSTPTGTKPLIYLSLRSGDAASSFATNRGSGGNFTITGTLALSSTNP